MNTLQLQQNLIKLDEEEVKFWKMTPFGPFPSC